MHTRLESMDRGIERLSLFYAERARGGARLIVTGDYAPNLDALLDETSKAPAWPWQSEET